MVLGFNKAGGVIRWPFLMCHLSFSTNSISAIACSIVFPAVSIQNNFFVPGMVLPAFRILPARQPLFSGFCGFHFGVCVCV